MIERKRPVGIFLLVLLGVFLFLSNRATATTVKDLRQNAEIQTSLCFEDDMPIVDADNADANWHAINTRLNQVFGPGALAPESGFQFHYDLDQADSSESLVDQGMDVILKAAPLGRGPMYRVKSTVKLFRAMPNMNRLADQVVRLDLITSIVREFNLDDLTLGFLAQHGRQSLVDPLANPQARELVPMYQTSLESDRSRRRFPDQWFERYYGNHTLASSVNDCESEAECPINDVQRLFLNEVGPESLRELPVFKPEFQAITTASGDGGSDLVLAGALKFRRQTRYLAPMDFPAVRKASRSAFEVHVEEWRRMLSDGHEVTAYEVSLKAANLHPGANIQAVGRWFHEQVDVAGLQRCEESRLPTGLFARMNSL